MTVLDDPIKEGGVSPNNLFGLELQAFDGLAGFICAAFLILGFYIAMRIIALLWIDAAWH